MTPAVARAASCQFMTIHLRTETWRIAWPESIHLCMVEPMNDRLTKSDWIDHGLRTLSNDGPNALKIGLIWVRLLSWIPAMHRSRHRHWTTSATCLKSERSKTTRRDSN